MTHRPAHSTRICAAERIDWNHHVADFGDRGQNPVGEKLDIGAHAAQDRRQHGSFEHPEWMINDQDGRAFAWDAIEVALRYRIADLQELQELACDGAIV